MPLRFSEDERQKLDSVRRSRVEEKRRTLRAAILLDSFSGLSDESIAQRHHVSRSTVVLCIEKCLQLLTAHGAKSVWRPVIRNCRS